MTPESVRQIAQQSPVPNLSKRWGELTHEARRIVAQLDDKLRELDQVTADLAQHDLHVTTDLGPAGNAFRHARTAQQADADTRTFSLKAS